MISDDNYNKIKIYVYNTCILWYNDNNYNNYTYTIITIIILIILIILIIIIIMMCGDIKIMISNDIIITVIFTIK